MLTVNIATGQFVLMGYRRVETTETACGGMRPRLDDATQVGAGIVQQGRCTERGVALANKSQSVLNQQICTLDRSFGSLKRAKEAREW